MVIYKLWKANSVFLISDVQSACCEFLEQQLDPSNCLGIKTFAETHSCEELRKAAEKYILKHFVNLVESEEFLQLSSEDVESLIKCDNLTVSEIIIFLSVTIIWPLVMVFALFNLSIMAISYNSPCSKKAIVERFNCIC